jgi:mRNA interferase HigB
MRVIAFSSLRAFADRYPKARPSLQRWYKAAKLLSAALMSEIQATFPKAKVLNGDRVRFEIAGGQFRLIAAFDFEKQIAFVKFLGTHAEYDEIDALIVSQF